MENWENFLSKIYFENWILKSNGQEFEKFFSKLMQMSNPNFEQVKPYGKIGDRKNDGFDKETGTYYQVYGPEDLKKVHTIKYAEKKVKEDFKGLYEHWNDICPIKEFVFVINDKNGGLPSDIHEAVIGLGKQSCYSHVQFVTWSAKNLEKIFDSLDISQKQNLVGFMNLELIPIIEFDALTKTVNFLLNSVSDINYLDKLDIPVFDKKIVFNRLNNAIKNHLIIANYQEGILMEYFNNQPGIKEVLQKKFRSLYEESKNEIKDTMENFSNKRFKYILAKSCVEPKISIHNCVLVLMAYYFSSCDIFEEPK